MALYKIILAYNGTAYQGFQRQPRARTVQGVIEDCLRSLGWQGASILAAGRTDTGVHASGQVISFDLDWAHPDAELRNALNSLLPPDIAVRSVQIAPAGFHPRYDALARTYVYRIYSDAIRDPLQDQLAWQVWPAPQPELLQRAAQAIQGRHNFSAFGSPLRVGGSLVRTVRRAEWTFDAGEALFEICADAFLYRMVRRLVYVQVAVGQGRLNETAITQCLETPADCRMQGLAPAHGLTLVKVEYPEPGKDD